MKQPGNTSVEFKSYSDEHMWLKIVFCYDLLYVLNHKEFQQQKGKQIMKQPPKQYKFDF